jgi:hypothetical protein
MRRVIENIVIAILGVIVGLGIVAVMFSIIAALVFLAFNIVSWIY